MLMACVMIAKGLCLVNAVTGEIFAWTGFTASLVDLSFKIEPHKHNDAW